MNDMECSLRKQLLEVLDNITKMVNEDTYDPDIILDRAEQMIFALAQRETPQNATHVKNILVDVFSDIHTAATVALNGETTGLSTGFSSIDNIIVGMNPGDLIVVGARPAMGKTAFAMNIALNIAAKNKTVAVFSLELKEKQIVSRLLSSEAFVDSYKFKTGHLSDEDWTKLKEAGARLSECDLHIYDDPNTTVTKMKAKLRKLKKLDLVIIDYLQLIQSESSEIGHNLKIMAKEFGVPVIVMSQVARVEVSRKDKRPVLSDLRGPGTIKEDADVVMFLYRDDYRENMENDKRMKVIIAKNKHGAISQVELGFEKKFTRFYDIDEIYRE